MQSLVNLKVTSPGTGGGTWPAQRSELLDWLMIETRNQRFIDNILVEMGERLVDAGVPVARMSLHLRIQHPQ